MKGLQKLTDRWSPIFAMAFGTVFLGAGLTSMTMRPPLAMTGVTLMAALAGAKALSLRRGLMRGLCVGLIGGTAIVFALDHARVQNAASHPPTPLATSTSRPATGPSWQFTPRWTVAETEIAAIGVTTLVMSVAAAGVFAWAAKRRRDLMG